ncbi:hypothetical protein [Dyadobacter sp. CY312]|uniref:hypothetical protein n=1 Tax=Dyadobacter sp. CY312 TaxID=2907303 RepID=UPI001F365977|nr:hypothetical protein [Dyadobacter sp. CY312]MCE7042694.1 hypothetical protein [Dyadobacter sp. CY312]
MNNGITAEEANNAEILLSDGYKIEPVAKGSTYPTGCETGGPGPHVIEAGYSCGEEWTEPWFMNDAIFYEHLHFFLTDFFKFAAFIFGQVETLPKHQRTNQNHNTEQHAKLRNLHCL